MNKILINIHKNLDCSKNETIIYFAKKALIYGTRASCLKIQLTIEGKKITLNSLVVSLPFFNF